MDYSLKQREGIIILVSTLMLLTGIIVSIYTNVLYMFSLLAPVMLFFIFKYNKLWLYYLIIYFPLETIIVKNLPNQVAIILKYSIEPISILLLLFIICKKCITKNLNFKIVGSVGILLVLFLMVSIVSSILNDVSFNVFLLGARWFLRYIPILLIVTLLDWRVEEIRKFFLIIFGIILVENAIGFLQLLGGETVSQFLKPGVLEITDKITQELDQGMSQYAVYSTFGRYSAFALFLSTFFVFIFANCILTKKNILLLLCTGFMLVLTYARQAVLGVIVGIVIMAILHTNKKLKLAVIICLALVSISFLSFLQTTQGFVANDISQGLTNRFFGALTYENFLFDINNYGRLYFIFVVGKLFLHEAPLLGVGMGMYGTEPAVSLDPSIYIYYNIPIQYSMDVFWVSILGQVGMLGILLWVLIYILCFTKSVKLFKLTSNKFIKWFALGYAANIGVILFESFFSSNLNDRYQSFYFWLLTGFLLVLYNKELICKKK
ncbi:O-antigen ligase family protein [Bacillus sp. DX1.1]|uniref:O-antigen ligase family protein n=1 Tax=unclassified Bacillus (in: firmicutes) TaxID=185979 RepID=UPI002570A319|nr:MULTISPECIES: O-antigen ligase family protein [unclassified Bacillus (in: firmicutes)]MDM5157373.1 O-antigen ligase family protein [Bacillus sp. DX1.1]WJE81598.1 O-antigen ligase family protein [Bacillus sp. DX3.1]